MLIDAVVSQTKCKRFLAGDGITTPEFTISAFPSVFEGLSIDAKAAKKSHPVFGDAFSVAKNLDEYQYKICMLVPSLPDSPVKIMLQKYRIAIAAAFAKFVGVIRQNSDILQMWTRHAHLLLIETSDAYVAAIANNPRAQKPALGAAFEFFGLQETDVDKSLARAYGQ